MRACVDEAPVSSAPAPDRATVDHQDGRPDDDRHRRDDRERRRPRDAGRHRGHCELHADDGAPHGLGQGVEPTMERNQPLG